jgi:hypothetical protein
MAVPAQLRRHSVQDMITAVGRALVWCNGKSEHDILRDLYRSASMYCSRQPGCMVNFRLKNWRWWARKKEHGIEERPCGGHLKFCIELRSGAQRLQK